MYIFTVKTSRCVNDNHNRSTVFVKNGSKIKIHKYITIIVMACISVHNCWHLKHHARQYKGDDDMDETTMGKCRCSKS